MNRHIRSVTDRIAAEGYLAIAPAVFDHVEPGFELGYDPDEGERNGAGGQDRSRADAAGRRRGDCRRGDGGKVGIIGFCIGGHVRLGARRPAYRASPPRSAITAGGIIGMKDLRPLVPTMLHFGEKDEHIPVAGRARVRAAHPEVAVYIYPAGHGFHCDQRASYDAPSAKLAWGRTMEFFGKHLG